MLEIINPITLLSWLGFGLTIIAILVIGLLLADDVIAKINKKKGK